MHDAARSDDLNASRSESGNPPAEPNATTGNATAAGSPAPWLSLHRVELPEPVEGYVDRPALMAHCDPVRRRLTAVSAPAGFGKTTLLAAGCRQARQRGHLVAWLCLDERDDPSALLSYLALSFVKAGLDIRGESNDEGADGIGCRLAWLLRGIRDHGAKCVLVLDDLHRLATEQSVDLLNRVILSAPPNLCLALAYREQPRRLAVAPWILHGQGLVLTVEELRFTRPEIARFFDTKLSREELAWMAEVSGGWPFALRLERNLSRGATTPAFAKSLAANWIETKLLRGLAPEDRNLIAGAAIFRRADEELLDGVLGPGSSRRLAALPALRGLVGVSDGAEPRTLDVHPLVRVYCADKLARETPERLRALHVEAARVLGRRGDVVDAMRHANEGGDPSLAATILEDAGAIRFWLRHGMRRTRDADSLLPDVLERFPRLALARAALLTASGRLAEADRVYAAACARTDGMRRDREGGSDRAIEVDNQIFKGLRALFGCRSVGDPEVRAAMAACRRLADHPGLDRRSRAALRFGLSVLDYQAGEFESSLAWAHQIRDDDGRYLWMYASLQFGATAFARGASRQAAETYRNITNGSKDGVLYDTGPAFAHEALIAELELETNGTVQRPDKAAPFEELARKGAWLDIYVATAESAAELGLRQRGPLGALGELERALDFARRTGRPALRQCLGALCVEMLALAGRLDRADEIWTAEGLPETVEGFLDRRALGWRERECICRGRLQLLLARRDFAAGEALAQAFIDAADAGGLRRSLSWALAMAMALAHAAGNTALARERTLEYLRLHAQTGYARALIRQRRQGLPLLEQLDGAGLKPTLGSARTSLLRALRSVEESSWSPAPATPEDSPIRLSRRELEIVHRLDKAQDSEIAQALRLSESGVRYHVGNIFRKLGVNDRNAAAQRAREL